MGRLSDCQVWLGLGGSFQNHLISATAVYPATNLANMVACWPLKELVNCPVKNIIRNNAHGTITGGSEKGIVFSVPEGALGMQGTGATLIEVDHDATPLASGLSLSFTGTDMGIMFLINTSTNDATLRCLICKQTGAPTSTNGWHVGIQNGAIVFRLRVGGADIFNFSRGNVADSVDHHVACVYDGGTAAIYIDFVQSGASVAAGTLPAVTTSTLRMFKFQDDSGPFSGSLCYMTLFINSFVSTGMDAALDWTVITAPLATGLSIEYGMDGNSPTALVASTGHAQFTLLNLTPGGAVGYYTPGHPNVRTGFDLNIPVLIRLSHSGTNYDWRGYIRDVAPEPGENLSKHVIVTCVDWIDRLAEAQVSDLPTQLDKTAKFLLGRVVNSVDLPPAGWTFQDPGETYPVAFDKTNDRLMALTEAQRLMQSGFGHLWVGMSSGLSAGGGGKLNYVDRVTWQGKAVSTQFDNTMSGLAVVYSRDTLINKAQVTYNARTVGGSAVVLHEITSPIPIAAGQTLTIGPNPYSDPADRSRPVGGTDFTALAAGTDYAVWLDEAATTIDITAFVTVSADAGDEPGGSSVTYTVTNFYPLDAFITTLQIRGKAIFFDENVTATYADDASTRQYGARQFDLTLAYQNDHDDALSMARHIVASRRSTLPTPREMMFHGDISDALMTQALAREPGDLIELREAVALGTSYKRAYIQRKRLEVKAGRLVDCTWTLTPQNPEGGYWVLGVSQLGANTVLAWG